MKPHLYLRAYLAGVFVTTLILPLMLTAFIVVRLVLQVPVPIERGLVFPMALVPAGWGLWNMLWLASHERTHLAVGVHGDGKRRRGSLPTWRENSKATLRWSRTITATTSFTRICSSRRRSRFQQGS